MTFPLPDAASHAATVESLRHDFPGVSFFHSAGIWYATGLCVCRGGRHTMTLHAPDADGLREQLGGRERSEDGGHQ